MMFLLGQRRNNNAQKKEILGDENLELPFVSFGDIVTATNNFSEANYHLVARPINPLKTDDLPLDISKILMKTERISEMEANFDTNLI